jgi:hypothetical protein
MIFWNLETTPPRPVEELHGATQLGLDPTGRRLFARAEDQTISTYDPWTGELLASSTAFHGNVPRFEIDPTGGEAMIMDRGGITTWDVRSWNRLLTKSFVRPRTSFAVTRFAGEKGVVIAGGLGAFTYHEIEPSPELYEQRRTWHRAARLVREKIWSPDSEAPRPKQHRFRSATTVELVREVTAAVKADPDLAPEVRQAALKILRNTTEDAKRLWLLAFDMLSAEDEADYGRALEYAREALRLAEPGTFQEAASRGMYSVALFKNGDWRDAIDEGEKALAMDGLRETARNDWKPEEFANRHNIIPFLAMAHLQLGENAEAHARLETAWQDILGGPENVDYMGEAHEALGLVTPGVEEAAKHSAMKASGPPDAAFWHTTHGNAWFPANDADAPWLEVEYDEAMPASEVWIYEIAGPGAVVRVSAVDEQGGETVLWEGADPTAEPGVFRVATSTRAEVKRLRIELEPGRAQGAPGIDTVRLVGPDGRQWPVRATASSARAQ